MAMVLQEPLSSLEAEYKSGSPILLEKIKVLLVAYCYFSRVVLGIIIYVTCYAGAQWPVCCHSSNTWWWELLFPKLHVFLSCKFNSFNLSHLLCYYTFCASSSISCYWLGLSNQEHILESQDKTEVDRIKTNVENCRKTLRSLGYTEFTFEDFFAVNSYHSFFF